jgi:hypothetical protein
MVRLTFVGAFFIAASLGLAAHGQETDGNRVVVAAPSGNAAGAPLNKDHLAPTGKTLPHPGVPQASGTTELDHKIQEQDDRTEESICKGC